MKKVFEAVTVILAVLATFSASSASWIFFYQVKIPKSVYKLL